MMAITVSQPGAAGRRPTRTASDLLELLQSVDTSSKDPAATGFSPLDEILGGGMAQGDLLLVGGRPGQGKTVATLQWARSLTASGAVAIFACYEHDELALVSRLLLGELADAAVEQGCTDVLRLDRLGRALRDVGTGRTDVRTVLRSDPLLGRAAERFRAYADRLVLVRASTAWTDLAELDRLVDRHGGERTALFVDYLQKVPAGSHAHGEAEQVKRVAEGLKELALSRSVPVVATVAADTTGLRARRLRLVHCQGSSTPAYEADVGVVLNDKLDIVSKVHLAYDTTRAATFRSLVVFTVEKNRRGEAGVDLEFRKDFAHYRFDPVGGRVMEQLWEEGSIEG
jgi:replicative DNA helicase